MHSPSIHPWLRARNTRGIPNKAVQQPPRVQNRKFAPLLLLSEGFGEIFEKYNTGGHRLSGGPAAYQPRITMLSF
jgi:hypothetical protein